MHNLIKACQLKINPRKMFWYYWDCQRPSKVKGDPESKALINVEISVLKKAKLPLQGSLALVSAAFTGILPGDQSDYVSYT